LGRFEARVARDQWVDQGQDRLGRDGFEVARRKRFSFGIPARPRGSEPHDDAGFGTGERGHDEANSAAAKAKGGQGFVSLARR
jgi:hypothetical protein